MKKSINVGIIIVNYNGAELTIDCINSLIRSTFDDYKIYIVDNGSRSEDVQKLSEYCLENPKITLIDTRFNNGIAEGNNIGIRKAISEKCNYIMLLNNDTVIDENMLEILVKKSEEGYKLCTPLMFYYDNPKKIWCAGGKFNKMMGTTTHLNANQNIESTNLYEKEVEFVPTCCLLIEASLFNDNLFDPLYFLYYDDTDFLYKLNKKGYKILFIPSAKLWHKVSSSSGGDESPLSIYYLNRNRLYFINKNYTGLQKLFALVYTYVTRLIRMFDKNKGKIIYTALKDYHLSKLGYKDFKNN